MSDFCVCHPGFRPTTSEINEAVRRYLAFHPSHRRFMREGASGDDRPGYNWKPITPMRARSLVEFWALHPTQVEQKMYAEVEA